jgi:hypothetical protein
MIVPVLGETRPSSDKMEGLQTAAEQNVSYALNLSTIGQ